jgi:Protein of unknown function (DUF998)
MTMNGHASHGARQAMLAGAVAGPLFALVGLAQIPTRDGFDMTKHAFSFLLLGPHAWIQAVNFVTAGLLYLWASFGFRRTLIGRSASWASRFAIGMGTGLILAGLFKPDPAFGYPPGTPGGAPVTLTTSGIIHGAAFLLSMTSWVALLFILWRWFRRHDQRRLGITALITAIALLVVPETSAIAGATVVLYVIATAAFVLTSVFFLRPADRGAGPTPTVASEPGHPASFARSL